MDIPQDVINKWQVIWQRICDMAYSRKHISHTVLVEKFNYTEILGYMINASNFEQITLDYIWKQVSSQKNPDGSYIQPLVVTELKEMYVPRILFSTPGVFHWFKHSFPNCSISYWEDDM
jgi:hypothetical protein